MTDEQLIERIRAWLNDEVVELHPPADLLERLRSAPAGRRRRPLWLPSGFGGALAMVAGVAVVGLVVVAIASIGHRGSSSSGISSVPAGVPLGARALVVRMAILRRPQTAADRLPRTVIAQEASSGGALRIIPGLTRLAAKVDAGPAPLAAVEIYVVVGRSPGYPADIVTALEVVGSPGHRYLLYPANVVDTETVAATGGLTARAVSFNGGLTRKEWLDVGVVPDGVTPVKWVFPAGVTVYPKVANNVAVPTAGTLGGLSSATWYGSGGRVLASYNEAAAKQAEATQALAVSAGQTIAPALIEHFAIFRRHVRPPATIKQLPEPVAVIVAKQGYGLNVTQARFVSYPGTPGLWAIPGAGGVSMVQLGGRGGGGDNVPIANALSDGMITTSCCAPAGKTVWRLVPDGNPTVTALLAGGTSRTVRVIDNVYSVPERLRRSSLTTPPAGAPRPEPPDNASGRWARSRRVRAMPTFVLRLIAPRPNFAQTLTDPEREIMNRHAAHWRPYLDRGDMVVFGPILTDEDSYGLAVVETDDEQALHEFAAQDPVVTTGTAAFEFGRMAAGTVRER